MTTSRVFAPCCSPFSVELLFAERVLLQNELPNELAGTSVAILLFLNSVVCNLGPWFVAWQDPGTDEIRYPLYASVRGCFSPARVTGEGCDEVTVGDQ